MVAFRTKNTVTLVSQYPYKHIQVHKSCRSLSRSNMPFAFHRGLWRVWVPCLRCCLCLHRARVPLTSDLPFLVLNCDAMQIVLRRYLTPAEVLLGFDVDSCSLG